MRVGLPSILAVAVFLGASTVSAQSPDAGVPEDASPEEVQKEERPRLVKPEGDHEDNEQLGGEPSLTEPSREAPPAEPDEECDLDCLEAQLDDEEENERRTRRTLDIARETGAVSEEVKDDAGDALAAGPSTTPLEEEDVELLEEGRLPTRLGPVRIRIGETEDWIGIGLATQMEFGSFQRFPTAGFSRGSRSVLQFRRIRATLSSSLIEGRIQSRFQINLTPSSFELIDLWFAFTRFKFATFRLGQFKIPYDRYRAQSFAALSFVDWAPTTRMFGSERQVGVEMLESGGFLGLEYSVGVFSGVNARAAHGVGITEVYGESPTNASDFGFGEVVSAFHPEIAGRIAKNFREINTDTNTDVLGTKELRHSVGTGIAWDARPEPIEDLGLRLSFEWLGKIRYLHMNFVSYLGWYKPWQGGRIQFGPIGFMGEVGYRFTLIWELALRYSVTYLTSGLRDDARSYGEFQIMNAADPAAATEQYGRNGDQQTNEALSLAGTSYIIGNSLKAIAEAAWLTGLWNTGRRHGFRANLQLQLLF